MNIKKLTLKSAGFPEVLKRIPDRPETLYCSGAALEALLEKPCAAMVGSRGPTAYGRQVTADLARGLAERGIVIVSGLALGVDCLAHRAALEAGGCAIAVLPGPLDNILPVANRRLARRIIEQGGALVSEYAPGSTAYRYNFVARNRLVSGLSEAVLITEAAENSGSLHTANFALDQGKNVLAVPGNINSPKSAGTNNLIKSGQAQAVTSYADVLNAMGLEEKVAARHARGRDVHEQSVLDLMLEGVSQGDELLRLSRLPASDFNRTLTMLEIGGKVRPLGTNHWGLA